jgi:hypothetical protein
VPAATAAAADAAAVDSPAQWAGFRGLLAAVQIATLEAGPAVRPTTVQLEVEGERRW